MLKAVILVGGDRKGKIKSKSHLKSFKKMIKIEFRGISQFLMIHSFSYQKAHDSDLSVWMWQSRSFQLEVFRSLNITSKHVLS